MPDSVIQFVLPNFADFGADKTDSLPLLRCLAIVHPRLSALFLHSVGKVRAGIGVGFLPGIITRIIQLWTKSVKKNLHGAMKMGSEVHYASRDI